MEKAEWVRLATTNPWPDGTKWTKGALERLAAYMSENGPATRVVELCDGNHALEVMSRVEILVIEPAVAHG